jgi:hypothetical protein
VKVSQLLEILGKLHDDHGDCEVHAGLASTSTEFRVVDAAYLDREPPARELIEPGALRRPRVVLALELP